MRKMKLMLAAFMTILLVFTCSAASAGTYTSEIDNADSTYNMYLSFESSVPKLDWRSNEVCIKLLRIIAKELDK